MKTLFLIPVLFSVVSIITSSAECHPQMTNYDVDYNLLDDYENAVVENDQDDPAYSLYKNAYTDILHEDWQRAYEKMDKILRHFPQSFLKDDAEYWSAYALSYLDEKKAMSTYENFIKLNRGSRYYTDAVADLTELRLKNKNNASAKWDNRHIKVYVKNDGEMVGEGIRKIKINTDKIVIGEGPETLIVGKGKITIRGDGNSYSYSYNISSKLKSVERVLQYHTKRINRLQEIQDRVDPKPLTKQREINVVVDTDEMKESENNFRKLRKVVLDLNQPLDARETALMNLSAFKKIDVLPVFVDVAKRDTSEDIQFMVVDILSNKEKSISVLINLFNNIPPGRKQQREMVFYRIAENGGEEAVDFLKDIALSNEENDFKNQAIYFLGSIGGSKSREALLEILNGK
ncbi:MAG: hypothetical protein HZB59_04125 [Ignavibacteriales bacterium]|nr:hypothetical protein [Ignavibacteriales bacterium]